MTDYCKQILGKSLDQLEYQDIEQFFENEQDESTILEFKSGQVDQENFNKVLREKIIRGIASLLNSEGGVLIWGTPQEQKVTKGNKKVRVAQGALSANKLYIDKDQLVNKIISNISYLPTGIRVSILENQDNYVYIFEVQESDLKPHQFNFEYPIRLDGHTEAAPHYIVDSMFNQIKYPELDGRIKFKTVKIYNSILVIEVDIIIFNKSPFINEKNLSFQLVVSNGIIMERNHCQYFSKEHTVLHFGRPYLESHVFRFDNYKATDKIKINLSFGGELGPALSNEYEIKTSNLINGKFNFNEYITKFSENLSFKNKQENLGTTHEENLIKHLQRN